MCTELILGGLCVVSLCDVLSDRFNPILTNFPTLQVKDVYDTGLYALHLVLNKGRAGFDLGYKRKVKKIASRTHARNRQAVPPSNGHITSIATMRSIQLRSFP